MEKTTFITAVKEAHEMQSTDAEEYYKEIPRIIGPISTSYPLDQGWIIQFRLTVKKTGILGLP